MKTEICAFSQMKIYPGHGKRYIRVDNRPFWLLNGKCEAAFLHKRNPRRTSWTVVYRRLHRKGAAEEIAKRKTRKARKFQRGVVGASLDVITAKRNQKPEVRTAQRQAAIREGKEKAKQKQAAKKATAPAANKAQAQAQKAAAQKQQKAKVAKQPKAAKPTATSR